MDMEVKNFIKVWVQATIGLSYCYLVSSRIPKGLSRLASLLPVIFLFLLLPLNLSSFHLTFITAAFLVWFANFKLLLFAFDQGPLSPSSAPPSPIKLLHFILIASLPIKIKPHPSHQKPNFEVFFKGFVFGTKVLLFVVVLQAYQYRDYLHDYVVTSLYCCHVYLELEFFLAIFATPARFLGFELERQFNEPYLSTSLQDFWSRRWNIMISSILRPAVFEPVKNISTRILGLEYRALWPSIIAVFIVSGLMHELLFYYITRAPPTWEQVWYFFIQGVCLIVEILVKKMVGNRWQLHKVISRPFTMVFMAVTSAWLFFPVYLKNNMVEKCSSELFIFMNFIKDVVIKYSISMEN